MMPTRWFPLLILALALTAGCERHRWLEIRPGAYTQIRGADNVSRGAARGLQSLTIDRRASTVILNLADGSLTALPFVARDRADWPSGCPTNLFHHYMEVLDLDADVVSIGDLKLHNPILVSDCPTEPEKLVLREEGQIGVAGSAINETCLIFTRE